MSALQKLFRRTPTSDPIRESAALTTVHLLELNQKFEAFVREKIEALEPVVSSLEARGSHTDDDWDDDTPAADGDLSQSNEPPPLPEMKLVTQMAPPLLESAADEPPPPPAPEPARAHQSLQGETGVGAVFSFDMLADDAPGAGEAARQLGAAAADDNAGSDLPTPPGVDSNGEADDDMDDDEALGVWDLADDLPPGPVGEYE